MSRFLKTLLCVLSATLLPAMMTPAVVTAADVTISVETPMTPPNWAVLERELLRANESGCREFFDRYFDERGYLLCVERWGGDDGPGSGSRLQIKMDRYVNQPTLAFPWKR